MAKKANKECVKEEKHPLTFIFFLNIRIFDTGPDLKRKKLCHLFSSKNDAFLDELVTYFVSVVVKHPQYNDYHPGVLRVLYNCIFTVEM